MKEVEGYVERITFRNDDNGYTVLYLSGDDVGEDGENEVCCVGYFSYVTEGMYIKVQGKDTMHKNYGHQIQMEKYEEKQPENSIAVEKYLGSGAIKGIGPALAARIVRKFGDDTFDIIERQPERLAEIKGISQKMAISVSEQFNEKRQMRQAMIFLQDYGISMNLAVKIYKHYGDKMYDVLQKNPYRLASDISGVGFKMADTIAKKAGFYQDSEYRIQAGIVYVLQQSGASGHCYLPEEELIGLTAQLLLVERETVAHELDRMTMDKELIIKERGETRLIYQSRLYYMEMNCARMLLDLNIPFKINETAMAKKVSRIEREDWTSCSVRQYIREPETVL